MSVIDKCIIVYICFWKNCVELFNTGLQIVSTKTVSILCPLKQRNLVMG